MATDTYKYFDAILKQKGITAYRVATDLNMRSVMFTHWKQSKSQPKYDKLSMIANYLGVTVDDLTGTTEAPVVKPMITDQDLMFALFGDDENITKDDLEDVKRFAQFIKEKKSQ